MEEVRVIRVLIRVMSRIVSIQMHLGTYNSTWNKLVYLAYEILLALFLG